MPLNPTRRDPETGSNSIEIEQFVVSCLVDGRRTNARNKAVRDALQRGRDSTPNHVVHSGNACRVRAPMNSAAVLVVVVDSHGRGRVRLRSGALLWGWVIARSAHPLRFAKGRAGRAGAKSRRAAGSGCSRELVGYGASFTPGPQWFIAVVANDCTAFVSSAALARSKPTGRE